MKFIQKLFDFYIKSSLHVAFALTAMGFISLRELTACRSSSVLVLLFALGIVAYNFVKYIPLVLKPCKPFSKNLKLIIGISTVFTGYLLFYFTNASITERQILLLTTILTVAYTFPIFPHESRLRQLVGIKTVCVALCWTLISVLLPVIHTETALNLNVYTVITQRFLLVFVLILPFDIQDIQEPDTGSIPKKIGVFNTKCLGIGLLAVYSLLFLLRTFISSKWYWANLSMALLTAILLWQTPSQSKHRLHSAFFVESIPIMYALWIYFFSR